MYIKIFAPGTPVRLHERTVNLWDRSETNQYLFTIPHDTPGTIQGAVVYKKRTAYLIKLDEPLMTSRGYKYEMAGDCRLDEFSLVEEQCDG